MKFTNYIWYLIAAFVFYYVCDLKYNAPINPTATKTEKEIAQIFHYDNLQDPEQLPYISLSNKNINIDKDNVHFSIYPQASYRIYAMVMSKSRYYFDWSSKLSPYDLALAWNKLMLQENQKGISYSQGNRWYYFYYDNTFPLDKAYIEQHSANTHIIPANGKVFEAVDKVRVKEKIYMEGYLVYIDANKKGAQSSWHSSLTRYDTGDGACEVFYVNRAILNGKIYE